MGAVGGAGEGGHQRARPQQEQRPPHSMGAGGGVGGGAGAVEPHLMGTGGGAGAMLPPYLNGSRGRGRSGGDTATAAVAAAGVGTVGGDRRSGCGDFGDGPVDTGSRRAHRNGTIPGGGFGAETVAAILTRGQQEHLVVLLSSPGPLQQQRYRVTPAVTRSRAQPPGVSRTFTLLTAEEDIARTLAQPDAALCDSEELPAGPAHLLETLEVYEEAHAGPHDRTWAKAERKEVERLSAVGISWRKGERSNEEPTSSRPSGCMRGRRMSLVRLCVLKLG